MHIDLNEAITICGGDNIAGVFDLTRDLSRNPPPTLFAVTSTTIHWWFSTWSPGEDRIVVSPAEVPPLPPLPPQPLTAATSKATNQGAPAAAAPPRRSAPCG